MEVSEEIEQQRLAVCRQFVEPDRERVAALLEDGYGVRGAEEIEQLERHHAMLEELERKGLATAAEEAKAQRIEELVKAARIEHEPLEMRIMGAEMAQLTRELEGMVDEGEQDDVRKGMTTDSPRETYQA